MDDTIYVNTSFGIGMVLSSEDNHFKIKINNPNKNIILIEKRKCTLLNIKLCPVEKDDLNEIIHMEKESYPSDEAASKESLFFRFIFANDYFKVLKDKNTNKIIGFICGTLTNDSQLTHESMSNHIENGVHLNVHSVVIGEKYRKNGFGNILLYKYVKYIKQTSLKSIRLLCKKKLINFYQNGGFRLQTFLQNLNKYVHFFGFCYLQIICLYLVKAKWFMVKMSGLICLKFLLISFFFF